MASPQTSFRLLHYFSITAGIAVLLVTLLISWTYYKKEVDDQVEAVESRNVVLARSFANTIWPQFESHLSREFSGRKRLQDDPNTQKLHDTLGVMARHVPVTKIKIYNLSGIAVYSSEREEIGENRSGNPAFHAARNGKATSEFTRGGEKSQSEGEIEPFDVVSTYIPIAGTKGEIQAVFELYSDVTDAVARIRRTTLRLLVGLAVVFAALYAVLLLIVAYADKVLRLQYEELKSNEEQIHAKNQALESEIEARRTVEAALRASEETADAANRAKTEFLSSMSHELRTPMNAILGFGQLLLSEPTAPLGANQRAFVEQILKAGRHLLELINEILDLARIEAGKMVLSVEPVSVADVVSECLPLIQHMAGEKNVRIEPLPANLALQVTADYMRLKQVLLNLLTNAVKYNRNGGRVSIGVSTGAPGRARISVFDTGHGIPEALQKDLFQPFQRLGSNTLDVEGTGIGLALTRNLVTAMNGEIGFKSVLGTGTTFWIDLPLAAALSADAATPGKLKAAADAGAERNGEAGLERSILYIEDNPANVLLMEQIAKRMSIRFLTAHNAEIGIDLAASQQPELIVMDIDLPQMSGFEALAQLKQYPETATIPVIALSANAMPKDVARGLDAGFLSYHTKPIDVEEIIQTIRQILNVNGRT